MIIIRPPPPPNHTCTCTCTCTMDEFFNATSQLVKSFWAGKVLQGLDLTEDDLDIASKDAAEGATLDLPPRPSPHDSLTSDALCCLATCETSLSARVHSVVTGEETETPSSGAMVHSDDRAVICSDGTLNWTQLTEYLEGEGDLPGQVQRDTWLSTASLCNVMYVPTCTLSYLK